VRVLELAREMGMLKVGPLTVPDPLNPHAR
jgi:hypothetical protein